MFKGERLNRRVVNFAIWDSDASNTDAMVDEENDECRCHQLMLPFEWEEGNALPVRCGYGSVRRDGRVSAVGLWVTVTGPNGHRTTLCDTALVYSLGTDVQHNLGYWPTPPENVLGR